MKRNGKGKKILRLSLILLVVFCLVAAGSFLWTGLLQDGQPPAVQTEGSRVTPEPTAPVSQLQGVIRDATMNTLTVESAAGDLYSFVTDAVDIAAGETGLMIGNPVTIVYRGHLDSGASVQGEAELVSVTVEDGDALRAEELLKGMTLEEKVGQMFLARCPEMDGAQKAADYHLGGYILFGRDFAGKSEQEVVQTVESYRDAAEIPLLIGVDEEGGAINRVSTNPALREEPFPSPQELYAEGGFDRIEADTREKCGLLRRLGINLNLAPVCDISQNPEDFMYDRSFGQSAEQTAAYVRLVVETMAEEGMGSVLKHFPGYGSNGDTHTEIVYDHRPYETFLETEFLPFQAGISAGADVVLVCHNVVSCMDDSAPASLSPRVHEILREECGFSGVIMTDDLYMDGVREFAGAAESAVRAVQAGNDLLCCTDFEVQVPAVLAAVREGEIPEERIDASVLRILRLKISLGLL